MFSISFHLFLVDLPYYPLFTILLPFKSSTQVLHICRFTLYMLEKAASTDVELCAWPNDAWRHFGRCREGAFGPFLGSGGAC